MKKSIIIQLIILFALAVNAQKLPNIQEASLRAPSNIKVDGKPDEWNGKFQAYNKADEIYYTISNDNEKLYLAIQATDLDIANKIIMSGLVLTINGSGKMKDQEGKAITFPILKSDDFPSLNSPPINYDNEPEAINEEFRTKAKEIKVTGIKDIKDTISIYNAYGIRIAALFDDKKIFTCELSVPLKQLGLSVTDTQTLFYNIKLKGTINYIRPMKTSVPLPVVNQMVSFTRLRRSVIAGIDPGPVRNDGDRIFLSGPSAAKAISLISPTDFSGEYTLAK